MPLENWYIIPLGVFAGLLAGYLGIGGGPVYLPILFLILGRDNSPNILPKICIGTSVGAVFLTSLSAGISHHRMGNVLFKKFVYLSTGSLVGSFAGGYIVGVLPAEFLTVLVGAVLILSAIKLILPERNTEDSSPNLPDLWLVPIGIAVGAVASSVGIGGGILFVPILIGFWGLSSRSAAGTSSAVTMILAFGALIGHIVWGLGECDLGEGFWGSVSVEKALLLGIPGAIGAPFGAKLHKVFKPGLFRFFFAGFLILIAVKIVFL